MSLNLECAFFPSGKSYLNVKRTWCGSGVKIPQEFPGVVYPGNWVGSVKVSRPDIIHIWILRGKVTPAPATQPRRSGRLLRQRAAAFALFCSVSHSQKETQKYSILTWCYPQQNEWPASWCTWSRWMVGPVLRSHAHSTQDSYWSGEAQHQNHQSWRCRPRWWL